MNLVFQGGSSPYPREAHDDYKIPFDSHLPLTEHPVYMYRPIYCTHFIFILADVRYSRIQKFARLALCGDFVRVDKIGSPAQRMAVRVALSHFRRALHRFRELGTHQQIIRSVMKVIRVILNTKMGSLNWKTPTVHVMSPSLSHFCSRWWQGREGAGQTSARAVFRLRPSFRVCPIGCFGKFYLFCIHVQLYQDEPKKSSQHNNYGLS